MGACQLKNSGCYGWLYDLVETKHKAVASGFLTAFDSVSMAVIPFYFLSISKNWFNLFFGFTVLSAICHFGMLHFAPDSPKWLLVQNRKHEAINAFNKIAQYNRSKRRIPQQAIFKEFETFDQN
jgi:hypothetical protein